ncbi:tash protein pest motif family, partial [Burkholderia pseudomallei 1026a]
AIELFAELRPVEVEVESEVIELVADDSPVDSDEIELEAESSFDATA